VFWYKISLKRKFHRLIKRNAIFDAEFSFQKCKCQVRQKKDLRSAKDERDTKEEICVG
jgi:hypothetical protein